MINRKPKETSDLRFMLGNISDPPAEVAKSNGVLPDSPDGEEKNEFDVVRTCRSNW